MTPARERSIDYVLWTAAIAWPLQALTQSPVTGLDVPAILAMLLGALLAPDVVRERKLRVPFEAWAPALAIAALTTYVAWRRPTPAVSDIIGAALFFVLAIQAGPSPDAIRRYLFASLVSIGAVASLSLLTPWLGAMPTAYSPGSGAALTFAFDLGGGVHTLLIGVVLCVFVASDRRFPPGQRAAATAVLVILVTLGVGQGIHWGRDTRAFPLARYPRLGRTEWAAAALALWLVARVLAKVEVQRRAPDRLAGVWWAMAVVSVGVAACGPAAPRPYQGLLLGLACANALHARVQARATRWPVVGTAALLLVAGVNLFFVFPENRWDERQYDAAAAREMPRVFERMDWIDRHAAHERRTDLWRARAALEYGLPGLASFGFERAVRPADGRMLLAPPTESERQAFLVRVRDVTAAMPEDRAACAYERVLLALGERDAAMYSLRLQVRGQGPGALIHVPTADAPPFAAVAAAIVDDPLLAEDMRTWTADEIVTLLIRWGADAAFEPEAASNAQGLFILTAQRMWNSIAVSVRVGDRVTQIDEPLAPVTQREVEALATQGVMAWSGPTAGTGGTMRYTLNVADARGVVSAAYVDLRADGQASFRWAESPPAISFTPAVRIRISK